MDTRTTFLNRQPGHAEVPSDRLAGVVWFLLWCPSDGGEGNPAALGSGCSRSDLPRGQVSLRGSGWTFCRLLPGQGMAATAEPSQIERDVLDPPVAFAELSKIVLGAEPLNVTLERIAVLARATMPEVDEVSMTLLEDGKAKTAVFTGLLAIQLDEQYDTGFGLAFTPRSAAKQSWWTLATARVLTLISPRQRGRCGVTTRCLSDCRCPSASSEP